MQQLGVKRFCRRGSSIWLLHKFIKENRWWIFKQINGAAYPACRASHAFSFARYSSTSCW